MLCTRHATVSARLRVQHAFESTHKLKFNCRRRLSTETVAKILSKFCQFSQNFVKILSILSKFCQNFGSYSPKNFGPGRVHAGHGRAHSRGRGRSGFDRRYFWSRASKCSRIGGGRRKSGSGATTSGVLGRGKRGEKPGPEFAGMVAATLHVSATGPSGSTQAGSLSAN